MRESLESSQRKDLNVEQVEGRLGLPQYFVVPEALQAGKKFLEQQGYWVASVSVEKVDIGGGVIHDVPGWFATEKSQREGEDALDNDRQVFLVFSNQTGEQHGKMQTDVSVIEINKEQRDQAVGETGEVRILNLPEKHYKLVWSA